MWIQKNQKSKIVDFEIVGDNDDFLIHLNQENLEKEGKELIAKLLVVLQTYKSSGCIERGKKFYDEYSAVSDYFLNVRDVIISKKGPRRVCLQNNLVRYNYKVIDSQHYPETMEGVILSWADRFMYTKDLYDQVKKVWDETKSDLRV